MTVVLAVSYAYTYVVLDRVSEGQADIHIDEVLVCLHSQYLVSWQGGKQSVGLLYAYVPSVCVGSCHCEIWFAIDYKMTMQESYI